MRIFLTGATGFIGSHVVPALLRAGHHVVGLSRSDAGAESLARAGADVVRGDVNDRDLLRSAAAAADGVIHVAFNHDFAKLREHSENDRNVIATLGAALAGSKRPLIVASGTGLARRSKPDDLALESDGHLTAAEYPRAASEEAADALIAQGGHVVVVRLPQVHDTQRFGRIGLHIELARQKGWVGYIGEGKNRLAAAHVSDVAELFRIALEKGEAGARYHAVAEEGVSMREIAEAIGAALKLPVESVPAATAADYFGPLAGLAALDMAASGAQTQERLGWKPVGPSLLTDLRQLAPGESA